MLFRRRFLICFIGLIALLGNAGTFPVSGQVSETPVPLSPEDIEARIDAIFDQMSVEERVELGTRVQALLDEQARLKQELPDLEAELAIRSRELDRLNGAVAMSDAGR